MGGSQVSRCERMSRQCQPANDLAGQVLCREGLGACLYTGSGFIDSSSLNQAFGLEKEGKGLIKLITRLIQRRQELLEDFDRSIVVTDVVEDMRPLELANLQRKLVGGIGPRLHCDIEDLANFPFVR